MQIAFHLGAPLTDNGELIWSLRQDRHALNAAGVAVPKPRDFRKKFGEIINKQQGAVLPVEQQEQALREFGVAPGTQRVVLSEPNSICGPKAIWHEGRFYGKAALKTKWLRNAFDQHEHEFFLATCNPATFLSGLLSALSPMTMAELLNGAHPGQMFWSDVVETIRETHPDVPITVWCNEDTPLIWPLVLAAVAGVEPDTPMAGGDRIARSLMTEEGQDKLTQMIGSPPSADMLSTINALDECMALFANEDELEDEISIPGWSDEHVEAVTEAYDQDILRIETLPDVTLIKP